MDLYLISFLRSSVSLITSLSHAIVLQVRNAKSCEDKSQKKKKKIHVEYYF